MTKFATETTEFIQRQKYVQKPLYVHSSKIGDKTEIHNIHLIEVRG